MIKNFDDNDKKKNFKENKNWQLRPAIPIYTNMLLKFIIIRFIHHIYHTAHFCFSYCWQPGKKNPFNCLLENMENIEGFSLIDVIHKLIKLISKTQ